MVPPRSLRFALISLTLLAAASVRAQGGWTNVDAMPTPRRLLAAASDGKSLYTFGGCGSPCFGPPFHTSTDEETKVEVFLPQEGRWIERGRMPTILFGAAAAALGGKIYTFGGYVSGDVVQEYDPGNDTWKIRKPMPTPRYGLAAVAYGGEIYVLGGSGPSAAVEIYDPTNDRWRPGAPMPTPRVFLAAVALGDRIYAIGGSPDCCGQSRTDAVEIYDPAHDRWETGPRLPGARQASAAVAAQGRIYVFGGFIPGSGVQADTLVYDPVTRGWTFDTPIPVARDQAPAVLIGSRAFVPGGSVDCHCRALGDTESFEPENPVLACAINGPFSVAAGAQATYSITVFNRGEAIATGVELGDFTPAGLSLASADEPCERGLPCLLGTIDPGDSRTTTVTFQVPPGCSAPKSFRPEAKVTSGTQESTCRPDRPTRIERPPLDLVCEKTGPLVARPGEHLAYQVAIRNLGCETALNVDVADPAPAGLIPDCGKPSCSTRIAKIPPLGSVKVPFSFLVPADHPGTAILNKAGLSQAQTQETPAARANNTCAATTPVRCLNPFQNPGDPPADLPPGTWGIVEGPAQAVEGSIIEYRILLANGGPGPQPDGDGHELDHLIPIGLEMTDYEADSGQLQLHEPTVSGDFTTDLLWDGAIPLCGTVTIRVKARVVGEAGSKICLQGTIRADRLTGLRGEIEKGEPFCFQVVLKPPA